MLLHGGIVTRKRRGMRTQMLLAKRWCETGLYPHATDAGAGRPGKDILNTPQLHTEVKAKGRLTLLETLRQAEVGADEQETVIVVWRHNGQGEMSIDEWTVTMRLATFERLWSNQKEGAK